MITNQYTVTCYDEFVIISSPIGTRELAHIFRFYEKHYGYDTIDSLIAEYFRAAVCLIYKGNMKRIRESLGIANE